MKSGFEPGSKVRTKSITALREGVACPECCQLKLISTRLSNLFSFRDTISILFISLSVTDFEGVLARSIYFQSLCYFRAIWTHNDDVSLMVGGYVSCWATGTHVYAVFEDEVTVGACKRNLYHSYHLTRCLLQASHGNRDPAACWSNQFLSVGGLKYQVKVKQFVHALSLQLLWNDLIVGLE